MWKARGVFVCLVMLCASVVYAQNPAALLVRVQAEGRPSVGAAVTVGNRTVETDADGRASLQVAAGQVTVTVRKDGFVDVSQSVTVPVGGIELVIDLVEIPGHKEEVVVVATTRSGRRVEEQPTRVEVLGREEIEEKMLMTPGDIVMMLNEMGGLRVQATSPSIGAASVRVQGMKGRYTRFLSDGLPLFGQQVGGLGLLQIPPMDLGQVEVIKGVASALYGAGAMGGVVNLLTRRPDDERTLDVLLNQSTLGGSDGVVFFAAPVTASWRTSLLVGGHRQNRNDIDDDGWADVAGYERVVVRPRFFWEDGTGRSAFLTAGVTAENREGGGVFDIEALDTRRYDVGGSGQTLVGGRYVLTARAAAAWQRHDHRFGAVRERDAHDTVFSEVAIRGAAGRHTWVVGAAYERDVYAPTDVPQFAYTFNVPGVFVQDDVDVAPWLSLSLGARVDKHSEYGTFFSPRVAGLIRGGAWNSRLSVGGGFFPATPLTEETEAAGLSTLRIDGSLRAERGTSISWDVTRQFGALSMTATAFGSRITDPVAVDRETRYAIFNRSTATTNVGGELLATMRRGPWVGTATYTYVRSREGDGDRRQDVALTPRHSAGFVGMWEDEDVGRAGLEIYFTGRQRLEANPYRDQSRPYVIVGLLVEKAFGKARVFLNGENLTNVRQSKWDSLLRPTRGVDGRWTVDAWAPVDGRAINGGVRFRF
jgi:iron complex outermembrane receptor protein